MGKISKANVMKTLHYLKRNGIKNTCYAVRERMEGGNAENYVFTPPTREELDRQAAEAAQYQVSFSIVVPAYRTREVYLTELLDCVQNQSYPRWELILADASEDDSVEKVVRQRQDSRIRYVRLPKNAGIADNTNQALLSATGDYIGLLDHDDVLTEEALFEMAAAIEKGKKAGIEIQMLYSDEDKCDGERTRYYEPNIKPGFNLDLLLSNNYICHFLVMKSELMKELGFRKEYDGAQDFDLVLRGAARLMKQEELIVHIPKVLYHWRCHTASTAENPRSKMYAYDAGGRALQDFADVQKWKANPYPLKHLGFYQMLYHKGPLRTRRDLGAVGGRLMVKNRTMGGGMSENGEVLFAGLRKGYSGYLNRAATGQNVEALDIRCIQVREELWELFEQVTGVSYEKRNNSDLFDDTLLPEGTDYIQVSLALSKAIRERGYRLLYTPYRVEHWDKRRKIQKGNEVT